MARDVNLRNPLVVDFGAAPVEMIDQVGDGPFVAGDELGGEHDGISRINPDRLVVVQGDSVEGREGLALAPGGQKRDSVARQPVPVLALEGDAVRKVQVAEVRGDLRVMDHTAAAQDGGAADALGELHHLLDARNVGGEGCHEKSAPAVAKDLLEVSAHLALGRRVALALDVGGVRQQQQNPSFTVGGEPLEIEELSVDRRVVDFEVARMDDSSHRSVYRQGDAVHQAVGHAYPLELKGSDLPGLCRPDLSQIGRLVEAVFAQLVAQQAEGQPRAEDRDRKLPQDVRESADMVFMGVCQDDSKKLFFVFQQVAYVGDDQIDPQEVRPRKHQAAVDRERGFAVLDEHHVEPELSQSAQGYDSQWLHELSLCPGLRRLRGMDPFLSPGGSPRTP